MEVSVEQFTPPKYTINLALPPENRYNHIANDFREEIKALSIIFDQLLSQLPLVPKRLLIFLSRLLLRKVYDKDETSEIMGIAKATGLDLYLLVAFNVLLDVFMGCTSGGIRTRPPKAQHKPNDYTKVLHFRTLDWGMDPLRKMVISLEYIEREGGPVIATSVTYFGYVGVLTGVRKGLSISLNFRPTHDRGTWRKRISFRMHQWLVVFGKRRSIASTLRHCLLPRDPKVLEMTPRQIAEDLKQQKSTAAYLTFCDGRTTVCMDQDNQSARIRESSEFIFVVNHDFNDEVLQGLQ